jgi:hypothetical protein
MWILEARRSLQPVCDAVGFEDGGGRCEPGILQREKEKKISIQSAFMNETAAIFGA